jgi:hypothetical protein
MSLMSLEENFFKQVTYQQNHSKEIEERMILERNEKPAKTQGVLIRKNELGAQDRPLI